MMVYVPARKYAYFIRRGECFDTDGTIIWPCCQCEKLGDNPKH